MRFRIGMIGLAIGVMAAGCSNTEAATPDLEIVHTTGYVVIVYQRGDALSIGFAEDRDALAGIEYDITDAVWRAEEGPWTEPPVTCVGKGQHVELGTTQVENEGRPGLLKDRVVWVACLAPEGA